MEVASPLAFAPAAGSKRSLACSPQLLDATNRAELCEMEITEESVPPSTKRRRFHADECFSDKSHAGSPFLPVTFHTKPSWSTPVTSLKRWRAEVVSPGEKELNRVVAEQALLIDSLKEDKSQLEESLKSLRSDHERISKENQILRRAVSIQQERQNHAENELKAAHQYREDAEDKMKKLEQIIVSLRYHLQTQQCSSMGNDFLHHRPPDVF